jgi:malonyl-CoA O-methyltransferase
MLRRLERAASTIDEADFVHSKTAQGLIERMLPMRLEPGVVVNLGCGTGARAKLLAGRFPGSQVIGVDMSAAMLARASSRRGWLARPAEVCSDATAMPFADNSVDLVFANMLLPYVNDLEPLFDEISRVLRDDGLFVFSTLGPDTFGQLRDAWQLAGNGDEHVRTFPDMHVIGDALVRSRLRDPVLDVEYLQVSYTNTRSMYRDLTANGARNSIAGRRGSMTGRQLFRRMERTLAESGDGNAWTVTLELVFGHGWGTAHAAGANEYHIEPGSIGRHIR